MINDLPTIYEVVSRKNEAGTSGYNHSSNKFKSNSKVVEHKFDPFFEDDLKFFLIMVDVHQNSNKQVSATIVLNGLLDHLVSGLIYAWHSIFSITYTTWMICLGEYYFQRQ